MYIITFAMKITSFLYETHLLVVYPHEVQVYDFFAPPLEGGVVTTVT